MTARTGALVALAIAVLNAAAVAVWAFTLGASPIVAMPVMALLTAAFAVLLRLDRIVTIIVICLAVVATAIVVVLGALSIGPYLLPAVVGGIVAAVLVARAGRRGTENERGSQST